MTWFAVGIATAGLALNVYSGKRQKDHADKAADASVEMGQKRKEGAYFEAAQLESNAGQEFAAAQREELLVDRRGKLLESRALAVAAASGAGASDVTMTRLIGSISGETAYQRAVVIYGGKDRARKLLLAAQTRRVEGDLGLEAGEAGARALRAEGGAAQMRATATLLTGGGSLFGTYGVPYLKGKEAAPAKPYSGDSALLYQNADAGVTDVGPVA